MPSAMIEQLRLSGVRFFIARVGDVWNRPHYPGSAFYLWDKYKTPTQISDSNHLRGIFSPSSLHHAAPVSRELDYGIESVTLMFAGLLRLTAALEGSAAERWYPGQKWPHKGYSVLL